MLPSLFHHLQTRWDFYSDFSSPAAHPNTFLFEQCMNEHKRLHSLGFWILYSVYESVHPLKQNQKVCPCLGLRLVNPFFWLQISI